MFYRNIPETPRALLVFTPEESKRLIAAAVVQMTEVRSALKKGRIIIASGSTNAYIIAELSGTMDDLERRMVGRIFKGKLDAVPPEMRLEPVVLIDGKISDRPYPEVLEEFTAGDVFIKGANAVDPAGNVGVLAGNPQGGTVGKFWALVRARGARHICPVGLEKLIPSVEKAVEESGQEWFSYSIGLKASLMPLPGALVVTEIEALRILYDLEATHIASGGVMGSEGSVVLSVKGEKPNIDRMWGEIQSYKNRE